ncbi:MAG TPA: hypothetical protein VKV95_18785 [Terriglobia bacterium]|nr:hypothetical protein [Terriglobia bacterium]
MANSKVALLRYVKFARRWQTRLTIALGGGQGYLLVRRKVDNGNSGLRVQSQAKCGNGERAMKTCVLFAVVHYSNALTPKSARNFAAILTAAVPSLDSLSDNRRFWLLIVILIILAAMIPLAFALAIRSTGKEMRAREQAAADMGFSFQWKDATILEELSQGLYLLNQGHTRKESNVMRGTSAVGKTAIFDYSYVKGTQRRNPDRYFQTVAAFHFPAASLPQFHLRAEHWWNKVGEVFGPKAIAFDSHPQFSKRYFLQGPDENAIRKFFHPSLLEDFQSLPELPMWIVEAADQWLLLYQSQKVAKVSELRSFLDSATRMAGDFAARAGIR